MAWNPNVYNKFKEERYAPFNDLLQLINVKPGLKVIDLGCGTGELTARLSEHLPQSDVTGIDSSTEMLQEAISFQNDHLHFEHQNIRDQLSANTKYDLVFSHAALQWVEDHNHLFPKIVSMLNKGGQLALQMPSNHDHFTHTALQQIASTEPYKSALNSWLRVAPVLKMETYAKMLFENGGTEITIFEKAYPHVLENSEGMFNWVSGTAMLPYIEKLPENLKQDFIDGYKKQLRDQFPSSPVFYPFKRIIMSAVF